ncbi:MAG: hypothetical protein PHS82_11710 [Lachnospiraceae bacterium]|nr:hypothetical protein [Lachnospiraceae bacterium]
MLYTEKQRNEIERVREVFSELLKQSPNYELLWSDKVGFVWLEIGLNPLYVDTAMRIESAADLCREFLENVVTDVLFMTGNDHALENADPLELVEIKQRWQKYIDQLPEYAYLCDELLNKQK